MPDHIPSINTRRNWIVWRLARCVLSLGSRDYRDALDATYQLGFWHIDHCRDWDGWTCPHLNTEGGLTEDA